MTSLLWLTIEYAFTPFVAVILPFCLKNRTILGSNKRKEFILDVAHDLMFGFIFSLLFFTFGLIAHNKAEKVDDASISFIFISFTIFFFLFLVAIILSLALKRDREDGKLTYKDNIRKIIGFNLLYFMVLVFCIQYGTLCHTKNPVIFSLLNTLGIFLPVFGLVFIIRYLINKEQMEIRNGLTNGYFKNKEEDYIEAIDYYTYVLKKAPPHDPVKINTYIQLSAVYENMEPGNNKKAIEAIRKAIALATNKKINSSLMYLKSLYIYKARFYKRNDQIEQAKETWNYLMKQYPGDPYIEGKYKHEHFDT